MIESNVIVPCTWAEVYDALFEGTYNSRLDRYRSRFTFRGLSSKDYKLSTSLMRLGGQFSSVESHLLRQFKKYAYQTLAEKGNEWFWISVAQHYGLPTRLLDWSYSPDVALHFATANTNRYDQDGAVWKVNYRKVHESLPSSLLKIIDEEKGAWILTTEMLGKMFKDIRELESIGRERGDLLFFFEPPSIDQNGSGPKLVEKGGMPILWVNMLSDLLFEVN